MELWSIKTTARQTATSEGFWWKQARLGTIPIIKVGRLVRLEADAVRSFLAARTRPAKPPREELSNNRAGGPDQSGKRGAA